MGETQGAGVEGLPGAEGEAVLDELAVLGVDGALADFGSAVSLVVEKGMADGGHVHADLVRAARLQAAFHDRDEAVALQDLPVGDGPFPLLRIIIDAEAQPVVRVPADGAGNGSLILRQIAPDHGRIDPVDGVDEELVREVRLGGRILGHDQKAARVLVDAVHQHAHPFVALFRSLGDPQIVGQGIDERPVVVPVSRMDHHSGGFVHDQHVLVLIDDIQGNVLGKDFHAPALVGHHELDDVAGADDGIGLRRLVVHEDIAQFDGLLDPVPGRPFLVGGDELVHPEGGLPLVRDETEMLEHLLLSVIGGRGVQEHVFRNEVGHFFSAGSFSESSVR